MDLTRKDEDQSERHNLDKDDDKEMTFGTLAASSQPRVGIAFATGGPFEWCISSTSVMRFKNSQLSVPEIARTLGVDVGVQQSLSHPIERGAALIHSRSASDPKTGLTIVNARSA